jgi:hypothetical protein
MISIVNYLFEEDEMSFINQMKNQLSGSDGLRNFMLGGLAGGGYVAYKALKNKRKKK